MDWLLDGIKIGMILCFLLGPIFFALVQAGVEHGIRAGTMVGLGIWISDLLFIVGVYFGLSYINQLVKWPGFAPTLGIAGCIILALFGLGAILSKPPDINDQQYIPKRNFSYLTLWLKGFLVNTINPFTVFFWVGLMGTSIIDGQLTDREILLYFVGILGTIMLTDFLKVVLAKRIRRELKPVHVAWFRRISGVALIVFGVVLLVRSLTV